MILSLQIQNKIKDIAKKKLEGSMSQVDQTSPEDKMVRTIQGYMTHTNNLKFKRDKEIESSFDISRKSSVIQSNESSTNQNIMIKEYLKEKRNQNQIYAFCIDILTHRWFTKFINIIILVNTIVLAQDRYLIDPQLEQELEKANLVFFVIFFLEMIVKVVGLGLVNYLRDKFNIFDASIVFISLIDVIIYYAIQGQGDESTSNNNSSSGAISAMRTFRLLRIFKLAQSWKEFQNLLVTIGNTMKDISNFSVLLFIFMFIYSLLGMELFAYKVKFDSDGKPMSSEQIIEEQEGSFPDSTFNTFLEAFTTVFIVLANDGWSTIYINHHRACGKIKVALYFVSLLILGQYILLNLFLAILIRNFDEQSLQEAIEQNFLESSGTSSKKSLIGSCFEKCFKRVSQIFTRRQQEQQRIQNSDQKNPENQNQIDLNLVSFQNPQNILRAQDSEDVSLMIWKKDNKVRQKIKEIVYHKYFENSMILIILVSSILLATEKPLDDPKSTKIKVLNIIDDVFSAIFIIECAFKIIVHGLLFNGDESYLKGPWNILDFTIVILSLISIIFRDVDIGMFKIIRLIKVLRPLRMISKNQGLQISIKALFYAIPNIFNVLLISLIFFFIFGIVAVSQFKGTFYQCRITAISGSDTVAESLVQAKLIQNKYDCINYGGIWMQDDNNFDDVLQAILTLFQMAITIGWAKQMYLGMWTRGIEQTREPGSNPYISIFFIAYIVVCSFFILNLFVGVVITTYSREKEKLGKNFLLTENQKKWLEAKLLIIEAKPKFYMKKPQEEWRARFYNFVVHPCFERFIMISIVLNTFVLCFKWYGQDEKIEKFNEIINYVFAIIFTLELIFKLIGFGKRFFKDGWNQFDAFIVCGTFIGILLSNYSKVNLGASTFVIRSFRICRMLKLFRRFQSLKIIFQTFLVSLPALANVGSLLFLLLYIYSILGMFLFAEVKKSYPLDENINFDNIGFALMTMTRASTGENWHEVMHAMTRPKHALYNCTPNASYKDYVENGKQPISCGLGYTSIIFFVTFIVMVSMVFINLFVAIILEGFQDTNDKDKKLFNLETTEYFREIWSRFDPNATCFIRSKDLPKFLLALGPPIGWDETFKDDEKKQKLFIKGLKLQSYNKFTKFQFMNILENLALNMIINKEVECMLNIKQSVSGLNATKTKKSHAVKVKELKQEIHTQIQKAENDEEAQMATLVRKRTLTRYNTFQSECDPKQIKIDEEPEYSNQDSELIKQYVLELGDSKNSSMIRQERHVSYDVYLANMGENQDPDKESIQNSREQYLKNLQESFKSANESSIASWGKSESSSQLSDRQEPETNKQDSDEDVPSHKLKIRKSKPIRAKPQEKSSENSFQTSNSSPDVGILNSIKSSKTKRNASKLSLVEESLQSESLSDSSQEKKQVNGSSEKKIYNSNRNFYNKKFKERETKNLENEWSKSSKKIKVSKKKSEDSIVDIKSSSQEGDFSLSSDKSARTPTKNQASRNQASRRHSNRSSRKSATKIYQFNNINIFVNNKDDLNQLNMNEITQQLQQPQPALNLISNRSGQIQSQSRQPVQSRIKFRSQTINDQSENTQQPNQQIAQKDDIIDHEDYSRQRSENIKKSPKWKVEGDSSGSEEKSLVIDESLVDVSPFKQIGKSKIKQYPGRPYDSEKKQTAQILPNEEIPKPKYISPEVCQKEELKRQMKESDRKESNEGKKPRKATIRRGYNGSTMRSLLSSTGKSKKSAEQNSSLKFNKSIKRKGSFRIKLVSAASQSHADDQSSPALRIARPDNNEKKQAHKNLDLNKMLENGDSESDFSKSSRFVNSKIQQEKCHTTDFTLKNPIIHAPLKTQNSNQLSPIKQVSESLSFAISNAVSNLSKTMKHKSHSNIHSNTLHDNIIVDRSVEFGNLSDVDQESIERDQVEKFEKDEYVDILNSEEKKAENLEQTFGNIQ